MLDRIIRTIEARRDAKRCQWGPEHFESWSHDDLVWRICFLQSGWRRWDIELVLMRQWLLPLACFVSALVGLYFGSR